MTHSSASPVSEFATQPNDLRVAKARVRSVLVPLDPPIRTASGEIKVAPLVLLDLETRGGPTGVAYVFTYTPLVLRPVVDLIRAMAELIEGEPADPLDRDAALRARFRLLGDDGLVAIALAALDMALWDIRAKAVELPLARLLGGSIKSVPAYLSVGMGGKEDAESQARRALDLGFKALKIKIGYASVDEDIDVLAAALKVLDGRAVLMADYNQSLSLPEALLRCRALDGLDLAWIEEPVLQDDYISHARIAQEASTPIQLGENWVGTRQMAHALAAGAGDLAMLDVMKIGGISGWLRAAALADAAGRPVSSHIFQEVSAQLLSVTPRTHWLEYLPKADPILATPILVVDGMARPSTEPGIGIAWNEAAIEKFRAAP